MPRREEPTPNLNVEFREGLPQFSKSSTEKIAKCTSSDLELVAFTSLHRLASKKRASARRDYWLYRDHLTIEGGVLLKWHRIIIPIETQADTMRKLHAPHQGTEKTSSRICKLERHKQRHRRHNQVLLHMPRITEQPTKGAPQPDLNPT